MSDQPQRKVFLASPSYDGRNDCRYTFSMVHTHLACLQAGIAPLLSFRANDAMIFRARNDLIRDFLESGCEDIVMIDADEEWDPRWIVELLKYPVEFVGAPVCKKSDDIIDFNVKAENPQIDMETGLVEVDSVGTGLLRISRKAMLAIQEISPRYKEQNLENHAFCFPTISDDGQLVSEDNALSYKWKKQGGSVYVAPHMDVVHVGAKAWRRSFREVLRARMEAIHGKSKAS